METEKKQTAQKTETKPKRNPGDVVEEKVKQWLMNQSYTTKLACVILYDLTIADHGTENMAGEIFSNYEQNIVEVLTDADSFENHPLSSKDLLMTGLAAELLLWEKFQ